MRQLLQTLSGGDLSVHEVPVPALLRGGVLVRTAFSLISAGTELMKVETAQKSLLGKALERPDQVRQVLDVAAQQGWPAAVDKVKTRLRSLSPLGYSLSGTVVEVGSEVRDFRVEDRVACAGQDIANHAEIVSVPRNLCCVVPEKVSFEDAACATVGAIALHGVHQARLTPGEVVAVIGLGLVGQLTVQLAVAAGATVIGVDLNPRRVERALRSGARAAFARSDPSLLHRVRELTRGRGVDAVLVTAGGKSSDPVALAGQLARDRGRVVVVGLVSLELPWEDFYRKELSLVLSRSYGPGRYDRTYERDGHDYPVGYVPFTERRNLEAFLDLVQAGRLRMDEVVTHRIPLDRAPEAFDLLRDRDADALGIVITYDTASAVQRSVPSPARRFHATSTVRLGVIGAGSYCQGTLLPILARDRRVALESVCSASGRSAKTAAAHFGFRRADPDPAAILEDPAIQAVLIATRHDSHAELAQRALEAGKRVFLEKPAAIREEELTTLATTLERVGGDLTVGFNRRFAPALVRLVEEMGGVASPAHIVYRVNAGRVPADHWSRDRSVGGGRIVGEACHFIDLGAYLCGESVARVFAQEVRSQADPDGEESADMLLELSGGSTLSVHYVTMGNPRVPKERLEVFVDECTYQIEQFRSLTVWKGSHRRSFSFPSGPKGQRELLGRWIDAIVQGEPSPVPFGGVHNVTLATFLALRSLVDRRVHWVDAAVGA